MKSQYFKYYRSDFGEVLYKLRTKYNLTQYFLSQILGCALVSIYLWEKGRTKPSIKMISKLTLIFDVRSDYFLDHSYQKDKDYIELLNTIKTLRKENLKRNFLKDFDVNL